MQLELESAARFVANTETESWRGMK